VACGNYLLEHEIAGSDQYLTFRHNRIVVRRISDGALVATVKSEYDFIVCAGPDEFLGIDSSVTSVSLPKGRRQWSIPVPRSIGYVVEAARTGSCTIGLTNKAAMVSICQGEGQRMVTTITR
jgi:hypothetical protein